MPGRGRRPRGCRQPRQYERHWLAPLPREESFVVWEAGLLQFPLAVDTTSVFHYIPVPLWWATVPEEAEEVD